MVIELQGISKRFGSIHALRDVSLRVEPGEFVTLLGPSGCGKTTLLRVVAGFVSPDRGSVYLGRREITSLRPNQRQVGMLFQNYALFPHLTVRDNVGFGPRVQRRVASSQAKKQVEEVLELVGLEGLEDRYPGQLSGGQQQRVALARTLAVEPRVLLLDEPMAALDRKLRLQMQVELKKLIKRIGITTICVTHDQNEALTMSDRIALMNEGSIEQSGVPIQVYDQPGSSFVASFLGNSNLFVGDVRADSGGRRVFDTGRLRLPLPDSFPSLGINSQEPMTLLVRPEGFKVYSEDPGETSLRGTVTFVSQLGGINHYEVELEEGTRIMIESVRSGTGGTLLEGEPVFVTLSGPPSCHLIGQTDNGGAAAVQDRRGKPAGAEI